VGQGNKKRKNLRKPGRYANGALISSAKAWIRGKGKKIRLEADRLAADLKKKGIKKPPGTEAGHNAHGPGKHGWESIAKNRAVETKNKKKTKLKIVHHHV
tara:strand:- start:308 stop:607 length:300 start_codon:yes stop_codon:yes gene_type:complete